MVYLWFQERFDIVKYEEESDDSILLQFSSEEEFHLALCIENGEAVTEKGQKLFQAT
jgi:hypothetical protein